jgi:hypothetical protein
MLHGQPLYHSADPQVMIPRMDGQTGPGRKYKSGKAGQPSLTARLNRVTTNGYGYKCRLSDGARGDLSAIRPVIARGGITAYRA